MAKGLALATGLNSVDRRHDEGGSGDLNAGHNMPPDQTPNFFTTGAPNRSFEKQTAFTV